MGHKPMNKVSPKGLPTTEKLRNYGHVNFQNGNEGGSTIRLPRTVLDIPVINNDNQLKFHPTQKPVELAEYFIKTYSNENDTILDNCMGSGSTGIACLKTKRNFIGIEINEEYYIKAKNWIEKEQSIILKNNNNYFQK
jgi:site-specific DNA-methyltransferase (adenine-specific)